MRVASRGAYVVALVLAVAGASRAEPEVVVPESPAPDARRDEALRRFNQGTALFEQGSYEAALRAFEHSASLYPTRAALKNQALCLERLDRPGDALGVLEALPRQFPSFSPDERRAYDEKLRELSARVGFVELRGVDGSWVIRVDGHARAPLPGSNALRLSPGARRLELRKVGAAPIVETLEIRAGHTHVLDLHVALRARQPAPRPASRPQAPPRLSRAATPRRLWLGVEGSALLAATGVVAACDGSCDADLGFGGRATLAGGYVLAPSWAITLHAGYLRLVQDVESRAVTGQIRGVGDAQGIADETLTLSGASLGAGVEHRWLRWFAVRLAAGAWLLGAHQSREADLDGVETVEQAQRVPAEFVFGSFGVLADHPLTTRVRVGLALDVTLAHALRRARWDEDELFVSSRGLGRFRSEALSRDSLLLIAPSCVARYAF